MILTVTLNAAIDKRYVVEGYEAGEVNRVKECFYSAGGKGLNVSRTAVIAGEKVLATGFAGGHAGNYILEQLKNQGIGADFVRVQGESRSCINIYDEVNRTQTEFLEPGFTVDGRDLDRMLEKFEELAGGCRAAVISGSVPRGAGPEVYRDMISIGKKKGCLVLVDTSGQLLEEAVKAGPAMIKPNIDEIRLLTGREIGGEEDLIREAKRVREAGVGMVVISLGDKGSLTVCKEGVFQAFVPRIHTVNTVGCGDSMTAGFAAGFVRGLSVEDTIRLASAISAANALREETGFFLREDMESLYPKIKIERLSD